MTDFLKSVQQRMQSQKEDSKSREDPSRRHNIKAAFRSIRGVAHLIKSGYRFDDEDAMEHLRTFELAIEYLEKTCLDSPPEQKKSESSP